MTEQGAASPSSNRRFQLQTRLRILAARFARALLGHSTLLSKRAQGRPGADLAPAVRCAKSTRRKTAQQHTGGANHSAFPARWLDGLCRALPGAELSFWPPSPRELMMLSARLGSHTPPQKLDRSNDGQDHTVLPYAHSPFRRRVRRPRHIAIEIPTRRTSQRRSSARGHGLTGTTRPARTSHADAAASTASPARNQDDNEIAPQG